MEEKIYWKKYLFTFVITAIIFTTAILLSNYFSRKKIEEIRSIQDKIAIDIMSSETQFSLLAESSCKDVGSSSLSTELGTLEEKLSYTEKERGSDDLEVQSLKRYYSLLEIKDYLLMNKISQKCGKKPISIIYFYSTKNDCPDCEKEGYVLTKLRQDYPEIRVYSFDYNLDLSALKTLININKIENNLPALYIKGNVYNGFKSLNNMEKIIPEIRKLKEIKDKENSATSTNTKN